MPGVGVTAKGDMPRLKKMFPTGVDTLAGPVWSCQTTYTLAPESTAIIGTLEDTIEGFRLGSRLFEIFWGDEKVEPPSLDRLK